MPQNPGIQQTKGQRLLVKAFSPISKIYSFCIPQTVVYLLFPLYYIIDWGKELSLISTRIGARMTQEVLTTKLQISPSSFLSSLNTAGMRIFAML